MPIFFRPTNPTQTNSAQGQGHDLARRLREEVFVALGDPAKIAFLAKVLNCKDHEVRTHPRLIEILDKIEKLFLSWINPEAVRTDNNYINYIADLHDRAKVPLSWVFEVMRKVHAKARVLKLPECFFERSDDFLQGMIHGQEKLFILHQERFQEERAYWQTIFNLSASPMVVMNETGQVIEVNDAYAKIHGYTLEAFKAELQRGASLIELTIPTERQAEAAHFLQAAASSQDGVIFEFVNKTKDGRLFPTLDMLKRVKTNSRQLILLTQIDLTELKQREQEIRQLLDDAQTYLQRLAAARLIHDERETTGAARLLQETYNQCVDNLQSLIGTVSRAAQTLMASSKELTQGQMVLSERASKEAASLEEISANIEEISSAVSESAKNAQETQSITEEILKLLNTSTNAMNDVVEVIFGASKAAQETTQIARLIEEIAFTTNLLSLNASVEAARAGQHGRGFAVIATEVRRLALKVSEESQRAQEIIQNLLIAINKGETGVQQVATVMDQIDGKSQTIAEHIQAIARATQEQDEGLKQIAQGINILDEGLAQNAAMAEEIHGTTVGLQEQTEQMLDAVQQFEIDRDIETLVNTENNIASIARAALAAHHRFRQHLQESAERGLAPDPEIIGDSIRCDFGQMLDNDAR